jgi:Zn-dependent metalloprotease
MFKPESRSAKTLTTYQTTRGIQRLSSDAARNLEAKTRGQVKIRWNSRTGSPRSVRGILTEPTEGSAQEIAHQFLAENKDLFGIREGISDLQYVQTTERRGIRHVKFRQVYHNLSVFGSELIVHIDQADRVQMVNGEYCPGIEVDTTTDPISKTKAIDAVLAVLEVEGSPPSNVQVELVVFPQGESYCRAYKVMLNTSVPLGNWVYFVDALSGEVVDGYNAMHFVKGKGSIYNSNPKRDDDEVVTAELFDLNGDKTLSGMYFRVENDEGPEAMALSDEHEFIYESDNSHFDETMVYYHLSRVGEFFRNLGHTDHTEPMAAHVHVADPYTHNPDYDNAYYSPSQNAIYFGHGEEFNDLAKEAAVIYHEYSHSIVEVAQPLMGTHEAGALHEGYADYFACSITNDPQIGEFVVEQIGDPNLRNLRNQKTYEDLTGHNIHSDGEIWGITCWKIYETLGRQVADRLIYESLWFLPPNATFIDAYEGIIQADTDLFGGEHVAEIDEIFAEQKILSKPAETYKITASAGSGGSISPSGKVSVQHGQDQVFAITPETGYDIQDVLVDGTSEGSVTSYTFEQVASSHKITASFEERKVYERTVIVPGNTRWLDAGVIVFVDDVITFTAHGIVVYDNKGNSSGPGGTSWTDTHDKEDPLWEKPHAGLIGKIGEPGLPFFIGQTYTIKAGSSGTLFLGVNDYWYQGNSGEFTVTIQVSKA